MTSSLAYTRLARAQETKVGDLRVEVEVVCEIIRMKCLSGDGDYISVCIERLIWNFRVAGPKGRVGGSLTITAINLDLGRRQALTHLCHVSLAVLLMKVVERTLSRDFRKLSRVNLT